AVYYPTVRGPNDNDREVIAVLARTAAMVIEREGQYYERLNAEKALLLSDERREQQRRLYEAALSNTPDFVYIFGLDYKVYYANNALLTMWGRSAEDTIGKTFLELGYEKWHADMHNREIDYVRKNKKSIRGEVPFTGTHGTRIYDYIFVPVFDKDGNVEAIAGTTRDVTDRKQQEEKVSRSEGRFRFLTEMEEATRNISEPLAILEIVTRMTAQHLNASRCSYADIAPEGDRFIIRADYVGGDAVSNVGTYDLTLFSQRAVHALNQSRTLVVRDVDAEVAPEDGANTLNMMGIKAIITCPLVKNGRLHALMALHQSEPRDWSDEDIKLLEIVAERSWAYIERAHHEAMLIEADRKKDEFLATLAHELRNPLAPIRNALSVLQKENPDETIVKDARAMMQRQVNQMVRLVDDLMDVSRITQSKIELRHERVLLSDVITSALETAQPFIDEKKHDLRVDLPAVPVYLYGDNVRLAQIFSNLLNNAAKYTKPGGQVEIRAEIADDKILIHVADNGIGIAADKLPHIFDLFTQVDNSIERSHGGLGIGLTLVKNLVARQGGETSATSPGLGQGSVFTVAFPLNDGATIASKDRTVTPAAPAKKAAPVLKIMIVDDNKESAQTMGWLIEMLGHEAQVYNDGATALEAVAAYVPDVVLLDIGMPGRNGYDICQDMRTLPVLAHTMFVAQTGWGQAQHRQRSREAGFDHHLVKPVELKTLEAVLLEKIS
ncbi:MAG: response regulator, partial [Alphaproteobacteria bacterium]|nr:response regulator [Alphaproteobacteria bacterium]